MIIDQKLKDELSALAKANPRKRMNKDLRTSSNDQSQRMLNALEPDTIIPIHRHIKSTETLVILRGKIVERYYNDNREVIEEISMSPNGDIPMISIPVGQWHDLICQESGTVIYESKDGAFEPISDNDILKV